MTTEDHSERTPLRMPWWLGWVLMAGIALFFLGEEHDAHILGALPWLLLLACPIIHLLTHGSNGHGGGKHPSNPTDKVQEPTTEHPQPRGGGT